MCKPRYEAQIRYDSDTGGALFRLPVPFKTHSPVKMDGDVPSIPSPSAKAKIVLATLLQFVHEKCIPAESVFAEQLAAQTDRFGAIPPILHELKVQARALGLWNLFLPHEVHARGGTSAGTILSTVEYGHAAEIMGWSPLAAIACNCSAPDTGNMEILLSDGSLEQQERWLTPLLQGSIRSAFLMTEPDVASSDARNICTSIVREGDEYVLNGRKWWATGAMNPECALLCVMGKTDTTASAFRQQSIVLVPRDTRGVTIVRPLTTFGYDDAPEGHAEVLLENVRVPVTNRLGAEGGGFLIAQKRLGRGRIHHCMRAIGLGERCLSELVSRATDTRRQPFGKTIAEHASTQVDLSQARIGLDSARLLVLYAAHLIDSAGQQGARKHIAMVKVLVPRVVLQVIDTAIQVHGGAGVSGDTFLARAWAGMRTLRIADGPDIVHLRTIALLELKQQLDARSMHPRM